MAGFVALPVAGGTGTTQSFYSDAIIIVATNEHRAPPLDRPGDVATAFAACWHAPHEGNEITFKTSFKRDGSIFGKPSITHMQSAGGADGGADLANSLFAAIKVCDPLPITPRLGAAIAERVFLIRLVAPRKERRADDLCDRAAGGGGRWSCGPVFQHLNQAPCGHVDDRCGGVLSRLPSPTTIWLVAGA